MFLNDDFVDGIERQVAVDGILDKTFMSRTFSYLRSNDLIYQPAIKSYMMGEAPPRLRPALLERRRHQPARADGGGIPARPVPAATGWPTAPSRCWARPSG
ncbi:MAG: hypothetical protein MZV65_02315 [Chromatiales bacterium]|nr:hypothetical protein [Chromatiales bacterium]